MKSGLDTDTVKLDGVTRFAAGPGGDKLDLGFVRVLYVPCSLVIDGAACWNRFVRAAKLPAEIARREPPVQACASAYARTTGSRQGAGKRPECGGLQCT